MTVTLQTFREFGQDGEGPDALRFALFNWKFDRPDYDSWATLVEKAVSYEVAQIAQRRADFQGFSEDALTAVLTLGLESIGLRASSARVNGNCDVTVSYGGEYLWLGEAKLFTGVTHVWGGYLQLTARYATGMPGQNRGGMLLYCFKDSASVLLQEWRATLTEQVSHSNTRDSELPLSFLSSEVQQATGLDLHLMHFAFPLLHEPTEDTFKLTPAALEAGRTAKKRARDVGGDDGAE